jgi:hypothetical protein
MTTRFTLAAAALALLGGLGLGAAPDDKKPTPKGGAPSATGAAAVLEIDTAYDLADLGRAEKKPALLIVAARMMAKHKLVPGDGKATTEGGKEVASSADLSMREQAERLLAEAKSMDPSNEAVAALVAAATKELEAGGRGAIGGPKYYSHSPGVGQTINLAVPFVPGQPATISVRGNGRNSLTLKVQHPGRGGWLEQTGRNPSVTWVPVVAAPQVITITNNGPGSVSYTLFTN